MTFTNINALPLGQILQIAFSKGLRVQMSEDYRDFEQVRMAKVSGHAPRSLRFSFQEGLLPSNVQWRKPGQQNRPYPRAFQPQINEYEAFMKEANASIELEANLYERAKASPEKYAEPLQVILSSSATSNKREIARAFYKDGTGVIAQVGSNSFAVTSPASDKVVVTLDQGDSSRGHVGDAEFDEILILRDPDSTATALDTNLATEPVYWKVVDKNREAGTLKLQGLNASFESAGTISTISTQPASGAVFYKYDQPTIPDLTASISDYGTVTEMLAGLESLAANDGRVVHGITMSGRTGASERDCSAGALDLNDFNAAMDQAKVAVGQGKYAWKKAMCAPETQSKLIESREGDRRFIKWEDKRKGDGMGAQRFGIQHRQDSIELVDSEYVHPKRIWVLPETKAGEKVIELHGSDFAAVKAANGSDDFHLKVSGGEYVNSMVSYLQATMVLICKHPKSIVKIRNFT